jgi:hypothetical protein
MVALRPAILIAPNNGKGFDTDSSCSPFCIVRPRKALIVQQAP